jgi:membrane-bound lytic murein transglycosylase A
MRALGLAALAAGLALSACATAPKPVARAPAKPPAVARAIPPKPSIQPHAVTPVPTAPSTPLSRLAGWDQEDHLAGLQAFQAGCGVARDPAVAAVCRRARLLGPIDPGQAKAFFEANFIATPVGDNGVLTAYFAPSYEARERQDAEFSAPVRPRPGRAVALRPEDETAPATIVTLTAPDLDDLIDVALHAGEAETERLEARERPDPPAPTPRRATRVDLATADRATIERSAPDGALAWMRPEDLFFLQIQGSGTLNFPNGRHLKAAYAADNGKPFIAIARPMVQRGIFQPDRASGESIRGWLAANRGARADEVMRLNPRYIFFDLSADDGREPAGAAGIPLTAGRAIAVDPSRHAYGDLYWIEAEAPILAGAHKTYRRLAMALDTGSAIRGQVRADLYIGRGDAAGSEAGRVRHTLRMVRLTPIDAARSARHDADAQARGG